MQFSHSQISRVMCILLSPKPSTASSNLLPSVDWVGGRSVVKLDPVERLRGCYSRMEMAVTVMLIQ